MIPIVSKMNIFAQGEKAKMLTVVISGRYNYKLFLFASLNFSVCNKVGENVIIQGVGAKVPLRKDSGFGEIPWLLRAEPLRVQPQGETDARQASSQGRVGRGLRSRGGLESTKQLETHRAPPGKGFECPLLMEKILAHFTNNSETVSLPVPQLTSL